MEAAAHTVLKAASHTMIIQPSIADNTQHQRHSGLIVAAPDGGMQQHIHRGVILDIGAHVDEPNAEVGGVIHYTNFVPIGVGDEELHVVGVQSTLAFE
jgi:hypothetical protein